MPLSLILIGPEDRVVKAYSGHYNGKAWAQRLTLKGLTLTLSGRERLVGLHRRDDKLAYRFKGCYMFCITHSLGFYHKVENY